MIFVNLSDVTAYRMLVPKWAVAPLSGAGAGTHGGRANRVGLNALYLALDHDTAVREYQQLSSLMPPGTLVSYTLTAAPIVDFTGGYESSKWSPQSSVEKRVRRFLTYYVSLPNPGAR